MTMCLALKKKKMSSPITPTPATTPLMLERRKTGICKPHGWESPAAQHAGKSAGIEYPRTEGRSCFSLTGTSPTWRKGHSSFTQCHNEKPRGKHQLVPANVRSHCHTNSLITLARHKMCGLICVG